VLMSPGTDAALAAEPQSSYRRDADSEAEEAFLLHTSWMDWPHGISQRMPSQSSTLIGQYDDNMNNNDKNKNNLANGRIVVATPSNSSDLTHETDDLAEICNCMFWLGSDSQNIPFSWGGQRLHLTQCVTGSHKCTGQVAFKFVERFKGEGRIGGTNVTDRQTDKRQTYQATENM